MRTMHTDSVLHRHGACAWPGAMLFLALLSGPAARAQQTLVRADGSQLSGQVQRISADHVDFSVAGGRSAGTTSVPCGEVICIVDGSLRVHTRPCGGNAGDLAGNEPTCNALLRNDNQVLKGTITRWADDRFTIRTGRGDVNVPRSDVAGVLSPGHVEFSLSPDRLKALMANGSVLNALNDASKCPPVVEPRTVQYSEKWVAPKFERAASETASEDLDFVRFKDVALEKTKRLSGYIEQITNKELSSIVKDKAVDQAIGLFERADNIVHVSNATTGIQKEHLITRYLGSHLRMLNYDLVKIEWADIQYASDFELQMDGSYTAVVSIQQRFTGRNEQERADQAAHLPEGAGGPHHGALGCVPRRYRRGFHQGGMMRTLAIFFALACAAVVVAQTPDQQYELCVKQFDEFRDRFNGVYKGTVPPGVDPPSREVLLHSVLSAEVAEVDQDAFVQAMLTAEPSVALELDGVPWLARVTCRTWTNGDTTDIAFWLVREKVGAARKWSILSSDLARINTNTQLYIDSKSHEYGFIDLLRVDDGGHPGVYPYIGPPGIAGLFELQDALLRSELQVVGIKRIEMHLLQLPGWFLLVEYRPTPVRAKDFTPSGWNITKLVRMQDGDKTAYLWHQVLGL
ncbi:MAG: hypothetical protein IPK99_04245 [Flavobacteriales bacterium]|nr:hypothetical protein [Flavobacteriales bacterium]